MIDGNAQDQIGAADGVRASEAGQVCANVARRHMPKMFRKSLEQRIYDALGTRWCGNTCPPGTNLRVELGPDYIAEVHNDGFEFWIGTRSEWAWHCKAREARRMAWFILWTWWTRGTWFGLRSWLWYRLLARRIKRYANAAKS